MEEMGNTDGPKFIEIKKKEVKEQVRETICNYAKEQFSTQEVNMEEEYSDGNESMTMDRTGKYLIADNPVSSDDIEIEWRLSRALQRDTRDCPWDLIPASCSLPLSQWANKELVTDRKEKDLCLYGTDCIEKLQLAEN
uniref:Uncharacterized protein n=1 Tax=Sphaerodactylus townsendi TaxID=933632 RepID=A0ACB8G1D6_9SAUR